LGCEYYDVVDEAPLEEAEDFLEEIRREEEAKAKQMAKEVEEERKILAE
jgi:hypothetical protein